MGDPGLPGTRRSRGKSWCRRVRGTPCRVGTLGARRRSSGWERTSCRSDFSSSWRTGTRKHDQLAAAEQFCSERKKHERTNFFFWLDRSGDSWIAAASAAAEYDDEKKGTEGLDGELQRQLWKVLQSKKVEKKVFLFLSKWNNSTLRKIWGPSEKNKSRKLWFRVNLERVESHWRRYFGRLTQWIERNGLSPGKPDACW